MKKWLIFTGVEALFAISALGATFTGAGADRLFSNSDNWDAYPATGATISIAANGAPVNSQGLVDAGFAVDTGTFKLYSDSSAYGTGTSFVHVVSGGAVKTSSLLVGNPNNASYDGALVVGNGGMIAARAANSGGLSIGGDVAGTYGSLLIENGADVSFSLMGLKDTGVLTFETGADSISTFGLTSTSSSYLNGLLQVDLDALTTVGSYTLLDSGNSGITGALIDDLATAGGTITDVSQSAHFNLLNADGFKWNLTTADVGKDLVLNVIALPATLRLVVISN